MEAMQKIKCLTIEDSNFPDRLRKLSGMPKKLYYIGNLPDPKKPAAAVVGARMCSPYGRCQAFKYARTMASYGVQIISGMARGIDAEGHKGALDTDTPTFAVLGSGVDVCYPNSNRWLYQRILEKGGGIISELPPGSPPVNWAFPARNAYSPEIMLMEWRIEAKNRPQNVEKKKLGLAPDLDLVYSGLDLRPENLDNLIRKTGFSASKVCALLTELQLMGLVGETGRQYYRISGG